MKVVDCKEVINVDIELEVAKDACFECQIDRKRHPRIVPPAINAVDLKLRLRNRKLAGLFPVIVWVAVSGSRRRMHPDMVFPRCNIARNRPPATGNGTANPI